MPRTIIIRQTYHCTGCRFESDILIGACPTDGCKGEMYHEIDPQRCGTLTVIGAEDIEAEATEIQAAYQARHGKDIAPDALKVHVAQRTAEMNAAIASAEVKALDPVKAQAFNDVIKVTPPAPLPPPPDGYAYVKV